MGRRANDLETPWGRTTKEAKGDEKVQVRAGGKRPDVCSFLGIIRYRSTILLLPYVFIRALFGLN